MTPPMALEKAPDLSLRHFVISYAAAVPLLTLFAYVLWLVLRGDFLALYVQVLFWIGLGYILTSVLAWTGFANVYRYSPTLYIGSPSYRQRVASGALYWEGRSTAALVGGVLFGGGLIALAAALWNVLFVPVDIAALASLLLVRASLRSKAGRTNVRRT